MSKHIYTEQYKQTGVPKGPEVVKKVKTDARPDLDAPDTKPEGPAVDQADKPSGPAKEG